MHSRRMSSRGWPLAICAVASGVGCHSDRIAGERPSSEVGATAVPPPTTPPPKTLVFIWGVNGHPGKQAAYEGSGPGLAKQFDYIDSLRARYYRIDLGPDNTGNVGPAFSGILDMAAARGVKILPVLVASPDMKASQSSNYSRGNTIGFNFARQYRGRFTHVEAGNELEIPTLACTIDSSVSPPRSNCPDGSVLQHYVDSTLRKTTSFLRGMAEGIHSGAPGTGVIIDAGFRHWAFFEALQRDGVAFDVYGYHWYSDMDNGSSFAAQVPSHLPDLNKEIWVTEVNRRNTDASPNNPTDQASVLARYIRDYYAIPRVKAFFVYELYEERAFSSINPTEAYYGIVGCSDVGCAGAKTLKPGFDAYRYGIEQQLFGYEDYVYSLFVHVNRRTPDGSGLAFWTNRFKASPTDTLGLINTFIPEESYKVFIRNQFVALLDRALTSNPTDSAALVFWNDRMRSGSSRLQVIVDFCVTPEFVAKSGSTNAGFVDRLYLKLWRKSSSTDPSGRTFWINQLNSGVPKWDVVAGFLNSTTYRTLFVQDQFLALLDRAATTSERQTYVSRMSTGSTQEAVIRMLLRLPEFGATAVKAGYRRRS